MKMMRPFGRAMAPLLRTRNADRESGQALIELALTIPIFLIILGGAIELGRVAYAAITVTNAAKAAVSYGATNSSTATDSPGITAIATADAANLPSSANFNVVVGTPTCVCKTTTTSTAMSTCASACTGVTIETLKVTTSASLTPLMNFPMFKGKTFNLTSVVTHDVLY